MDGIQLRKSVAAGRNPARALVHVAGEFEKRGMAPEAAKAAIAALTPREREVLKLLAMGAQGKRMAHELGISKRTVDTYRCRIRWKTRSRNIAEMVRMAIAGGLI